MPLQVAMKRTVQVLFALTPILAITLAGYGLKQVAGSVLLGGGGLTFALMMAMALTRRAAERAAEPALAAEPVEAPAPAPVEAPAPSKVEPKLEPKAAAKVETKVEPKLAAKGKGKRARKRARAAAAAAAAASAAAPKPKAVVVEPAPADRSPEIEEVAAFFVQAVIKDAAAKGESLEGFGADELAFFAEGENQSMRASDSSPHWHLGMG